MTNMYTLRCSFALLPLLCALLSTSALARHHSGAFLTRKSLTTISPPFSSTSRRSTRVDTSAFPSERDAKIVAAQASTLLLIAATLCRGGSQYNDYDDRGRDDYYSKQYNNDGAYNYDDNYYDERDSTYDDRDKDNGFGPSSFSMPDVIRTGNRKIGLPLLGVGSALTALGVILMFNKTLLRLGNLFLVAGFPMTIGPGRTAGYFFQPKKARATACLAAGISLVFIGWPIFGIILEVFGFLNLFGNMFPMALMILKQMPVIGPLLKGNAGNKKKNDSRRYDDFDRYEDDRDPYYDDTGYQNDDDRNRYY